MPAGVNHTVLVLGGARSGKSAYAERLLAAYAEPVYIATGQPFDDEMRVRIDEHRARRPAHWRTVEAPLELAAVLARSEVPALVDDLAIWLTNLLLAEADLEFHFAALEIAVAARTQPTILVSSETGLGIVPADRLSRRFRHGGGLLNQGIAAGADEVVLVVAGLPLTLK